MHFWKPGALLIAGTVLLAACSSSAGSGSASPTASSAASMGHESMGSESMAPATTDSDAANLRVSLDQLLGEHIILASKATGAALGGRNDQFAAYGDLLNTNGTDLGAAIGSIYGSDAQDKFNEIWSAHNGFFVDYTTGVATKDKAKADKAVADLTGTYVPDFSKFIAGATGLPEAAVTDLITAHVVQTKAIVDAQAAKDWKGAYDAIRTAYAHMQMIGDALAPAIATQQNIAGDPSTPAVDLRVGLNQLLQEHLYLASFATDAAIGGRSDEFAAAGAALNTNGTDLGAAIGSLYGSDAKDQFNEIWSAHNGFFVDYTTGVATKDKAKADKAVMDLTQTYVPQFSEFLAGATDLPKDALASLTTEHVMTTKAVVDAQGAGDAAGAAKADRTAGMHMRMIADPLAAAIVAKLPDKFGG